MFVDVVGKKNGNGGEFRKRNKKIKRKSEIMSAAEREREFIYSYLWSACCV